MLGPGTYTFNDGSKQIGEYVLRKVGSKNKVEARKLSATMSEENAGSRSPSALVVDKPSSTKANTSTEASESEEDFFNQNSKEGKSATSREGEREDSSGNNDDGKFVDENNDKKAEHNAQVAKDDNDDNNNDNDKDYNDKDDNDDDVNGQNGLRSLDPDNVSGDAVSEEENIEYGKPVESDKVEEEIAQLFDDSVEYEVIWIRHKRVKPSVY